MNIVAKYTKLKKLVGGNREKMGYEETFGMPREEYEHITMPNKWIKRILSELEFSIRLSEVNQSAYDNIVENTINYLLDCMNNDGVLTKNACHEAEEMLISLKEKAKEYKLILAGHAHIDMNWMWGWHETVASTLATFRTVLNIMDEYPDFCFSQSQASVYKIVEDFEPEMMSAIKARIAEGRWEITASAWVETDKNMPNTESLLRHIKYTKNYLKDNWGIDPASLEIDFSPDTFGHNANIPEIDSQGDVKYYYHCRALDGKQALYRWKAPSGKEMLVYREQYWYNSAITPLIGAGLIDISKRCAGFKTGLIVYGVGDHGGGPTRRDVERAIEMMDWPIFPIIKFGTFSEFFHEAESVREQLPLVEKELNYFAPGCYTTQSRIKLGNRRCESALLDAEAMATFAKTNANGSDVGETLEKAWRDVLFTHFHDILTGSCVQDSREHAMGLYSNSMAVANTQYSNAMRLIAEQIDTSSIKVDTDIADSQAEGAGAGYGVGNFSGVPVPERGNGKTRIFNIFNPTAVNKNELVEVTVWDWTGDMRNISVKDEAGNDIEFQMVDHSLQQYWDHKYFRFLADVKVDALGYTTIVLGENEPNEYRVYYQNDNRTSGMSNNFVLENENIRAEFDFHNGNLISLIYKVSGENYIKQGDIAGFRLIETERASSSAWDIGKHLSIHPITRIVNIRSNANGSLRQGIYVEYKVKSSTIKAQIYLDKHAKALSYDVEVDWHEVGGETIPVLEYTLPLSYNTEKYMYDVPGGIQFRESSEIDVPALQYGLAVNPNGKSAAIVTNCKYGYRGINNTLMSTLINTSVSPDPYPERGIHAIKLSVGIFDNCPKGMEDNATSINHKLAYQPTNAHCGKLPMTYSLFKIDSDTAVVSSVSTSKSDDSILIRVYETCGERCNLTITFNDNIKSATAVDIMENEVTKKISISHKALSSELEPNTITTFKVKI